MKMIRILIVEDEIPARKKLKRFLEELDTEIEVIAEFDSVAMGISRSVINTASIGVGMFPVHMALLTKMCLGWCDDPDAGDAL